MPDVLLSAENLTKAYGARPLFDGLSFTLSEGDHVGLVGPNGSGKSTLLKILAGTEDADSGTRALRKGVRVGYVPQDPVFAPGKSVEEVLIEALAGERTLDDHEKHARAAVALGKSGFIDRDQQTDVLSGGWRKRLAIARELVREPDVLLLDEPTNHLDIDAILWLEELLRSEPEAFIVVSHDRYFLENVATRMLELNRAYAGGLLQTSGTYSDLLEKRDETLRNEAAYQETLANLVRREMEWLRRGPKARTTKAKARIQNAERLIDELSESRDRAQTSSAEIELGGSGRKTKRLWSGKGLAVGACGATAASAVEGPESSTAEAAIAPLDPRTPRLRCIRTIATAAGVTPGIRLACPSDTGCTRESFSTISRERPGSAYDISRGIRSSSSPCIFAASRCWRSM
jgi:ATP-binding cassette subfamily F protein uup